MMDREALDDKENQEPSKEELQKQKTLYALHLSYRLYIGRAGALSNYHGPPILYIS